MNPTRAEIALESDARKVSVLSMKGGNSLLLEAVAPVPSPNVVIDVT